MKLHFIDVLRKSLVTDFIVNTFDKIFWGQVERGYISISNQK